MSHKATNWAVAQRGISPVAKVILWQLADRHNPDNGCFPEIDTLARDGEVSRATVIRILGELEAKMLVRRIKRVHPVTKKQLPNRYILGFEEEFGRRGDVRVSNCDTELDAESRVSECNPAFADGAEESQVSNRDMDGSSRVSKTAEAESQIGVEPGITAETPNSSLTGNRTSKGTGKRAEGRDRESMFEEIWKAYPERPGSPKLTAWEVFEKLDDADVAAALKGAKRFAAWWREQEPGKPEEERLRFVKYLSRWLHERGWIDAMKLPVSTIQSAEAAAVMAGKLTVNKWRQYELFLACERVLGRSVPVGKSGSWSFDEAVVEAAKKGLGSGQGPP
ncbi:MAG TPA: helix-turn-helix domain-containing protein [Devosia sp.]|nr:helix-turn-helix domain-containing protein [Devosia sp.]